MLSILNRFTCSENQLPQMISKLKKRKFLPILDYTNENFKNHNLNFRKIENLIRTNPQNNIAIKMSSLNINENYEQSEEYLYNLIRLAVKNDSTVMIDAENFKIQDKINTLSNKYMKIFNKNDIYIYKTYQMYRKDTFDILQKDFLKDRNYNIGCKLVRGAYYNQDYQFNILLEDINKTHLNYNKSINFFSTCANEKDKLICATHNEYSINYAISKIEENNMRNIAFAQLLGMSDSLSTELAKKYIVYKYLPFGNFKDTLPYLGRRLYENYPMISNFFR
tara:strand:+ start:1204 stop:2040 length:837 start_codon:yes stop_codon:yes gene_type:complete